MSGLNNPIDLTTLANVQAWLSPGGTMSDSENTVINDCITAASSYWLWALGLTQQNGEPWNADAQKDPCSPLNSVVPNISETYDGPGSARLFLRIRPIVSVQSLTVDGIAIPASSSVTVPGFVIDGSGKSLAIRSGFGGPGPGQQLTVGFAYLRNRQRSSWFFNDGIQNVQVTYSAGYSATPPDIEMAVRQMVAVNYKRRQWIDQRTQMMAQGAGSIQFRDWEFPPEVRSVMDHYRRRAAS